MVHHGGAKALQQRLFQRPLGGFGAGSVGQFPAEHFARAAVDDRHKGAPAVLTAVHRGDVSGPALVGGWGDGLAVLHTGRASDAPLAAGPAVQAHDAVDLLAVDHHAQAPGEACVGHAHAVGGVSLDDSTHGLHAHRIAVWFEVACMRLVVGGGAGDAEQTAQHADGHLGSLCNELCVHGYHEIPSGKSLP